MAKAALLGDNGDQEGEDIFGYRRQRGGGSIGGSAARAARAVRPAVGIAITGLGGPAPVRAPVWGGGGPGRLPGGDEGEMDKK